MKENLNNVQPLEYNQRMSNVAKDYAFEMYTKGFWCHKNPNNGELVRDRLGQCWFSIIKLLVKILAIAPYITKRTSKFDAI